jgi:hypothetical protein
MYITNSGASQHPRALPLALFSFPLPGALPKTIVLLDFAEYRSPQYQLKVTVAENCSVRALQPQEDEIDRFATTIAFTKPFHTPSAPLSLPETTGAPTLFNPESPPPSLSRLTSTPVSPRPCSI